MNKLDSHFVLNCSSRLVNIYLEKGFFIIEHNSKELSSILNIFNLIIHAIDHKESDFVMARSTAISSVANTINKLHMQSDLHLIYKQKFYHDKQDEIDTICDEYHIPLINYIDHTALTQEWKQNIEAAAYEENIYKYTIKSERNGLLGYHGLLAKKHKGGYQFVIFLGYHGYYSIKDRKGDNNATVVVKDFINVSDSLLV